MNILPLLLFFVAIKSAPIEENTKDSAENAVDNKDPENSDEQSRAGIIDTINPFNKNENSGQSTDNNKGNEENSNNPLGAVQNIFNSNNNPIGQLFSSQSGSNVLDNVKIFMVATQGMVMPASAALGGFQDLIHNIGNMGNAVQGAQNLLPTLPTGK